MKTTATLLSFFIFAVCAAQIPNAGFENWIENGWSYNPEDWETDNSELLQPVTQDLEAHEGMYAMKVTAVPIGVGDWGEASTTVPIDYIPASLDFWVKSQNENGFVQVLIEFFNDEMLFTSFFWGTIESISDWTFVSIEMNQVEPVLTHAKITVSALVGDLIAGQAQISIDEMSFGETNAVIDHSVINIQVYPNPAIDSFQFDVENHKVDRIEIYALDGKLAKAVQLNDLETKEVDISSLAPGMYQLMFSSALQPVGVSKLLVR
jgi:hypothetical protein